MAWLIDPGEVQVQAASSSKGGEKKPWNGEFYVSFGANYTRKWDAGDRIWVKIPGRGFVGVGRVSGPRIAANEFRIEGGPALDKLTGGYNRHLKDDQEKSEYFVPVDWLHTVPENQAIQEVGMFGNQNTVCKPKVPKWRATVERLKERFDVAV